MREISKNLVFEMKQKNKINKYHIEKKENLIEFENYFKYSGMIEYKKRFIFPDERHEYKLFEINRIKNDMSKYKLIKRYEKNKENS